MVPSARESILMNILKMTSGALQLCLALAANSVLSQNAAPVTNALSTNAPGGQRHGAPMSEDDKAEVAKLADLPEWKPGDGDGDYFTGTDYPIPAEAKTNDNVPHGRIESFSMPLADSKFYTGVGMKGARVDREVKVYIPSQ
jgi:hypothetical protein